MAGNDLLDRPPGMETLDRVRGMGLVPDGEEGDDVTERGVVAPEMESEGDPLATLASRGVANAIEAVLEVGEVLVKVADVGRDGGFFAEGVGGGVEACAGSPGELAVSEPCDERSAFARSIISRIVWTSERIGVKLWMSVRTDFTDPETSRSSRFISKSSVLTSSLNRENWSMNSERKFENSSYAKPLGCCCCWEVKGGE